MMLYGVSEQELRDAVLFYQRFKDMPTYKVLFKQIKREHLESELARIQKELDEIQ